MIVARDLRSAKINRINIYIVDSLVKIEGKPIEKLLDVVGNALGALCAPWQIKRVAKAEAEADRIKAIESAKTEALLTENAERYNALSSIEQRIIHKEEKRQRNIEKVIGVAAQTIEDELHVSSEPVNPDWTTRFFDIIQDISDDEMQDLWGRILAGEVNHPNSYSLRTLEALRNITREEAQLFEELSKYVLYDGTYFIYRGSESIEGRSNVDISYEDVARLIEIGFIRSGSMIVRNYYNKTSEAFVHHLIYANKVAFIEQPAQSLPITIPIYSLTEVGRELYNLITIKSDYSYFDYVLHEIKQNAKNVNIKLAQLSWIDFKLGKFEYEEDSIKEILH